MLSDRERQELSALESQFRAEDPRFADSFDAHARRRRRGLSTGLAVAVLVPAAIVIALALLVTDSVGLALGLAAGAVLFWGCWLSIKHSREDHKGPHR